MEWGHESPVPTGDPRLDQRFNQGSTRAKNFIHEHVEIEEFQVDTGWRPDLAHGGYWEHPWVVREMATLIGATWVR